MLKSESRTHTSGNIIVSSMNFWHEFTKVAVLRKSLDFKEQ